ncbi:MAG: hypothetical protein ACRCXW_00805, partial [Plesiomonas shigelloides]
MGVPEEHRALSDGSSTAWAILLPRVQVTRNVRWINYIWYNQQRFINHTIAALGLISEQLHATTLMTVENRFAIDQMRGPEQGVCAMLGIECCTIIPLHTGPMGPLSALLTRMKAARDQMVRNSGAPDPAWYKWLLSGDWMAGLMRIGMIIL